MNPDDLLDHVGEVSDLLCEYEEENTPMYKTLIKLIEAKKDILDDDQFFNVTFWAACSILNEEHEYIKGNNNV